jgi:hypothetical protein
MSWDDEKSIERVILDWLDRKGFTKQAPRADALHGVDIRRWNDTQRRYWFIEVKGAPQKTYQRGTLKGQNKSRETQTSQRYTWFITVLGQIALRMRQQHGHYGVALPDTEYNRKLAMSIGLFRRRARLHFFLVNSESKVTQLTPGSSRFKLV